MRVLLLALLASPAPACEPPPDLTVQLAAQPGVDAVSVSLDRSTTRLRHLISFHDGGVAVLDLSSCPPKAAVVLMTPDAVPGPVQMQALAALLAETPAAARVGAPDVARLTAAYATAEATAAIEERRTAAWDATPVLLPQGGGLTRASWAPLAFPWGAMLGVEIQAD
ncbi:MAG: hypothetical protein QM656_14830 [Paracoccaceae bacterium]